MTWLDQSEVADFSPDGSKILIHERGEGSESPSGTVYMVNSDGTSGLRLAGGNPTEFSPDGKSVLAALASRKVMLIPVGAGSTRTLKAFGNDENVEASGFLPDRRILLNIVSEPHQISIFNPANGNSQKVTDSFSALRRKKISPDGKSALVASSDGKFFILSLTNGKAEPIRGLQPGEQPIRWNRDGNSIYVFNPHVLPGRIDKLDIATGKKELFREVNPNDYAGVISFRSIIISDDEQLIAYSYERRLSTLYTLTGMK